MIAALPVSPAWAHRALGALAVACVALQLPGRLDLSALALALWLSALAWADRDALRPLWRPRFLAWSAALALLAGLLLGEPDLDLLGLPLSSAGLAAGALMLVRGGLILGLTGWLARRIVARARRGLTPTSTLGAAVATAVELMPALLVELGATWAARPRGRRLRALESVAVSALSRAVSLAEALTRTHASHFVPDVQETRRGFAAGRGPEPDRTAAPAPLADDAGDSPLSRSLPLRPEREASEGPTPVGHEPGAPRARPPRWVAAVSGPRGAGKTTALLDLRDAIVAAGFRVGGVAQPAVGADRGGYALEDVETGERRPWARLRADGVPGFDFDDAGLGWAAERLRAARARCDVVLVDEFGRLEAAGAGHLPALREASGGDRARVWVLAVRDGLCADLEALLGVPAERFGPSEREALANTVLAALRAQREERP